MKPDGSFLSKMAMDFFSPIPKGTPINADGINSFASFGPYYVASRQVGRQLIVQSNPNYHGSRPHNVGTFVFTMNTNLDQSLLQVKAGQSTTTPVVFRRRRTRAWLSSTASTRAGYFRTS